MDEKTMESLRLLVEQGLVGRQELDEAANTEELVKNIEKRYFPPETKNDGSRESDWREQYKEAAKKLLALGYKADDVKKMFL